jgi:hypothetical protein
VLLIVFCVGLALGAYLEIPADGVPFPSFSTFNLHQLSPALSRPSRSAEPDRLAFDAGRNLLSQLQQESLPQAEARPIYPYSVVPGGVKDAAELRLAAAHDPVVAAHYAGFDYAHARVLRLVMARTAYVSYRIRNRVYWTRRRVKLNKGETLITDGKTIARARCANQVKDVPPPPEATQGNEPPAPMFEEPIHPATGTAMAGPPVGFESALLNRPPVPGFGPAPPLGLVDPFGGGSWVPLSPPPLPSVCGVGKNKNGSAGTMTGSGKKKGNPCGNGAGGEVPEPGTWLLVATGLAATCWKARHRLARS